MTSVRQSRTNPAARGDWQRIAVAVVALIAPLSAAACNDADGIVGSEIGVTAEQATQGPVLGGFFPGKDLDGTSLAACNALHNGGLHPGKTRDGYECRIAWGGGVVRATLENYVDLSLVWSTGSDIWNRTVKLGYEAGGTERLYPCVGEIENLPYAGKTSPALGTCRIAWGEQEVSLTNYYLIEDFASNPLAAPVTRALKSSTLAWSAIRVRSSGRRYCLANGPDGSRHPGWAADGVCHYAYGTGVQHDSSNFSYIIPRYSLPGGSYFVAGHESNNSPLGACRVEHPTTGVYQLGKYLPTLNECHFEYGDALQIYNTNFTVLK